MILLLHSKYMGSIPIIVKWQWVKWLNYGTSNTIIRVRFTFVIRIVRRLNYSFNYILHYDARLHLFFYTLIYIMVLIFYISYVYYLKYLIKVYIISGVFIRVLTLYIITPVFISFSIYYYKYIRHILFLHFLCILP